MRVIENWRVAQDRRGILYCDYEVSDFGRVRRCRPSRLHPAGKAIAPILGSHGYFIVNLALDGQQTPIGVHVLVCSSFNGLPQAHQSVTRHLDGNKQNNHADNLRWGTHRENALDAIEHGRIARGADHPKGQAKLERGEVAAIKTKISIGARTGDLAREYGVHDNTISHIRTGRTWRDIQAVVVRVRRHCAE